MQLFPYIEFRSFGVERQACVKGRLQVWQVVLTARDYDMDVAAAAEHLSLRSGHVHGALDYYAHYGEEIDEAIQQNEEGKARLKRLFPDMLTATISDSAA